LQPTVLSPARVGAKDTNFDALRLSQGPIFPDLSQTFANGRIVGIVDVNVGTWSWVGCLKHFVAITLFLLTEGNLNGFFLK